MKAEGRFPNGLEVDLRQDGVKKESRFWPNRKMKLLLTRWGKVTGSEVI